MAFMMPVMKKNYNIYSHKQQRRTASDPDGTGGRKSSQVSQTSGSTHSRRRVRSEGPSLSTSPAAALSGTDAMTNVMAQRSKPIVVGMRRGRGSDSAPILSAPSSSLHPHCITGPSTAPAQSPAPISIVSSQSGSSSSTSSSGSGSPPALGRFHTKLINRLRRSLRLNMKDPEPTAT